MFAKTLLVASMTFLAFAAPTPPAAAPEHFTLLALHYGSPIHEQPIAFYGNRWVIDLPTIAPCEASNCIACKFEPPFALLMYHANPSKIKTQPQPPHS
jgi:hypothetical protein